MLTGLFFFGLVIMIIAAVFGLILKLIFFSFKLLFFIIPVIIIGAFFWGIFSFMVLGIIKFFKLFW